MTSRLAKSLALSFPPIRRLYQEVLDRNEEIARLRSQNTGDVQRRIAQLERDVIWRERQLEAMRQLGERINQPGTSKIDDLGEQYDVIFVTQDPRRIAPARARCYNFAEILQQKYNLKTRVLSFVDHLGMPDLGSGPVDFITDDVKLRLNADAMRYLLRHPKSIFYVQKTGYHFLSVLGAAVFNGNRIILDLDDHDFHHNSWPQLDKYLPSFRTPEAHVAMIEASTAVVVASHEIQKTLEDRGVTPFFLPTVPDLQRFSPSDGLKKILPKTDKVRIWWGGDVFGHVFDNVVLAFEHIASMPQQTRDKIEVVLCGYGDTYYLLAKHLKERFSSAFQMTELGAIAPDDMPALLSEIDIGFIMFNRWSNFDTYKSPTKMFELMAMEKAIIAERCGEPVHIISDGIDGFLAQGPEEWAAKMALLVDSAAMRKAMGKKARSKIENEYSLQVTMPILRDIIERVRTAPPGRAYAPKSFSDVPHRNAVSKIAPTVSMQMSQLNGRAASEVGSPQETPAGLSRRLKSWMVDNLPPQAVDKLRALNKVLRI
jgi:glycosyltransferase involved in cell wall biosynthesis